MHINPEFRRNLWLELTPSRLVGMPLVLGVFFFLPIRWMTNSTVPLWQALP